VKRSEDENGAKRVGTSDSLRQFHKEEHERWARLVKATGFRPE
jgi:hypothetical protein